MIKNEDGSGWAPQCPFPTWEATLRDRASSRQHKWSPAIREMVIRSFLCARSLNTGEQVRESTANCFISTVTTSPYTLPVVVPVAIEYYWGWEWVVTIVCTRNSDRFGGNPGVVSLLIVVGDLSSESSSMCSSNQDNRRIKRPW